MNEIKEQALIRARNLYAKRREILSLPPEKAMDRILSERQPAALVHSFPEQDFYFLIHDIGIDDAGELLALASLRQWEFILDAEIWGRDRIDIPALTRWLHRLIEADPDRLVRWAAEENREFFEYYLFRNVELAIREHDQDPSDLGEGFLTDDDVFYLRAVDSPSFSDTETGLKEARDAFLWDFLKRLSAYDHIRFQEMLLESRQVIPAEMEEEARRLRNVRRAENGFTPFDEAIGIYQPLTPSALEHAVQKKSIPDQKSFRGIPVSLYAFEMMERDNVLAEALAAVDPIEELEGLQAEFASLCNRVISADRRRIREREELREIVAKVCGYIGIGLEALTSPGRATEAIRRHPLDRIFRIGYARALDLKWRAEQWRKESWFEERRLPLGFWGEEWLGVLGGLLIKRPLFYDNYRSCDQLYREFQTMEDIRATECILENILAMDRLLSLLPIPIDSIPGRHLTWKNVLPTLWVRHRLGLTERLLPIPLPDFRDFYDDIWTKDGNHRKIQDSVKTDFLQWLSNMTRLQSYDIAEAFQPVLEDLFTEIEEEYGDVEGKNLEPRFVHLFLLL